MNTNEIAEDAIGGINRARKEAGDDTFVRDSKAWNQWRAPLAANDNLPSVVAIAGVAGSGKSTLADHLIQRHGYTRVKFAGPLKSMLRAIGLTDEQIEGKEKELPLAMLQGRSPRYAMQRLGANWGRDLMGEDFWTGLWRAAANDVLASGGRVVVDDCRFSNEGEVVAGMGGIVFHIQGRGGIPGGHVSEQIDVDADVVLRNVGTVADLKARADEVLFGGVG